MERRIFIRRSASSAFIAGTGFAALDLQCCYASCAKKHVPHFFPHGPPSFSPVRWIMSDLKQAFKNLA